jgi:TPR repeat protein
MRPRHAILPFVAALMLAAQPALAAHSGPEIKAIFDAGVAAYDAGDYQKAFKLWWDLQYEDVAAMRNVAMMLRKGQGTEKDPKKAEEIYQRAAEIGLPTAQADLASALPLLQAAAAATHPVAQFQLGELYETGAPPLVEKNWEIARQLYAAAASHGMKEAEDRLRVVTPLAANQTAAADGADHTKSAGPQPAPPAAPVPAKP